jgi:hypothetical protein
MSKDDATLTQLTAEVETLRRDLEQQRNEFEALRAQVHAARERIDLSMRGQTLCPACGCRKILFASKVLDRGDGDSREKMALAKPSFWRGKIVGQFEVCVCTACGLVEWYARDVHEVEIDGEDFRLVEGQEPGRGGPYR